MTSSSKGIYRMFPEYRDLIRQLKQKNAHFSKVFEEHNAIDHEIIRLEQDPVTSSSDQIELLKKQKLKLKDELYILIKRAETE
jgi:uncharacterized protein YdcH (DUF465 family)